jgi:transketolase
MRTLLANLFVEAVERDSKIYFLSGDHGYALFDPLRKKYPDHFLNVGVAEQNMIGVAAGMAKSGFTPIVYGLSSFVPIRVLEQIKLDLCYEKLKVIIIGDGAGAVYTTLGVSHQTFEDIASLRSLPNIQILTPGDCRELEWCFKMAQQYDGPSYIRIGKSGLENYLQSETNLSINGINQIHAGRKDRPVILALGSMVSAIKSILIDDLSEYSLYSVARIKPLSAKDFEFLSDYTSNVITVEEHNHTGGLGSLVAEIVSSSSKLLRLVHRIGADDKFSVYCGDYEYAMSEHGLSRQQLAERIIQIKY